MGVITVIKASDLSLRQSSTGTRHPSATSKIGKTQQSRSSRRPFRQMSWLGSSHPPWSCQKSPGILKVVNVQLRRSQVHRSRFLELKDARATYLPKWNRVRSSQPWIRRRIWQPWFQMCDRGRRIGSTFFLSPDCLWRNEYSDWLTDDYLITSTWHVIFVLIFIHSVFFSHFSSIQIRFSYFLHLPLKIIGCAG